MNNAAPRMKPYDADSAESRRARPPVRLAYLVSHPIQYQAPLLRRIAQEPDIDLTVLFGSDFSLRGYKDEGFGVEVTWDTPLTEGYRHEFLPALRDKGSVSATTPISRRLYRRLRGTGNSPAFDALWVHGYASVNAQQGMLAANGLGIPVLLRAESWLRDRARSPLKLAAKRALFNAMAGRVAAVLPIGTRNAEYWTHYFGDRVPQFLMPYAVDNAFFARRAAEASVTRDELRASLHLAAGRPVILFASKLQTRKHCDHLVEAYARFADGHAATDNLPYLVIVGEGEERARLEALTQRHNLQGVRFAGFQNQSALPRFFDLADVFVLPSRHEPWGLIVNEAMASGCAVITSDDVGSHADLITNGVEGFVYPTGDIDALRLALERACGSHGTAAAMGEAARRRIASWSFEEDVQGLRAALAHTTRMLRQG